MHIYVYMYIYIYIHMGFPGGSVVKNPPADAKELGAIPGFGRSWRVKWQPTQYSCLGNPMDRRAW